MSYDKYKSYYLYYVMFSNVKPLTCETSSINTLFLMYKIEVIDRGCRAHERKN